MSGEYYALVAADGTAYALPGTARPGNDWGEQYDYAPSAGTHASVFYMAGTGKALPTVLDLVMELDTDTELEMEALINGIVAAARTAVALRRQGGTAGAGFEVATLMGLTRFGRQVIQSDDSSVQQLTLSLARAAPGQTGYVSDPVEPGTGGGTATLGTATGTIDGVPYTIETVNYD